MRRVSSWVGAFAHIFYFASFVVILLLTVSLSSNCAVAAMAEDADGNSLVVPLVITNVTSMNTSAAAHYNNISSSSEHPATLLVEMHAPAIKFPQLRLFHTTTSTDLSSSSEGEVDFVKARIAELRAAAAAKAMRNNIIMCLYGSFQLTNSSTTTVTDGEVISTIMGSTLASPSSSALLCRAQHQSTISSGSGSGSGSGSDSVVLLLAVVELATDGSSSGSSKEAAPPTVSALRQTSTASSSVLPIINATSSAARYNLPATAFHHVLPVGLAKRLYSQGGFLSVKLSLDSKSGTTELLFRDGFTTSSSTNNTQTTSRRKRQHSLIGLNGIRLVLPTHPTVTSALRLASTGLVLQLENISAVVAVECAAQTAATAQQYPFNGSYCAFADSQTQPPSLSASYEVTSSSSTVNEEEGSTTNSSVLSLSANRSSFVAVGAAAVLKTALFVYNSTNTSSTAAELVMLGWQARLLGFPIAQRGSNSRTSLRLCGQLWLTDTTPLMSSSSLYSVLIGLRLLSSQVAAVSPLGLRRGGGGFAVAFLQLPQRNTNNQTNENGGPLTYHLADFNSPLSSSSSSSSFAGSPATSLGAFSQYGLSSILRRHDDEAIAVAICFDVATNKAFLASYNYSSSSAQLTVEQEEEAGVEYLDMGTNSVNHLSAVEVHTNNGNDKNNGNQSLSVTLHFNWTTQLLGEQYARVATVFLPTVSASVSAAGALLLLHHQEEQERQLHVGLTADTGSGGSGVLEEVVVTNFELHNDANTTSAIPWSLWNPTSGPSSSSSGGDSLLVILDDDDDGEFLDNNNITATATAALLVERELAGAMTDGVALLGGAWSFRSQHLRVTTSSSYPAASTSYYCPVVFNVTTARTVPDCEAAAKRHALKAASTANVGVGVARLPSSIVFSFSNTTSIAGSEEEGGEECLVSIGCIDFHSPTISPFAELQVAATTANKSTTMYVVCNEHPSCNGNGYVPSIVSTTSTTPSSTMCMCVCHPGYTGLQCNIEQLEYSQATSAAVDVDYSAITVILSQPSTTSFRRRVAVSNAPTQSQLELAAVAVAAALNEWLAAMLLGAPVEVALAPHPDAIPASNNATTSTSASFSVSIPLKLVGLAGSTPSNVAIAIQKHFNLRHGNRLASIRAQLAQHVSQLEFTEAGFLANYTLAGIFLGASFSSSSSATSASAYGGGGIVWDDNTTTSLMGFLPSDRLQVSLLPSLSFPKVQAGQGTSAGEVTPNDAPFILVILACFLVVGSAVSYKLRQRHIPTSIAVLESSSSTSPSSSSSSSKAAQGGAKPGEERTDEGGEEEEEKEGGEVGFKEHQHHSLHHEVDEREWSEWLEATTGRNYGTSTSTNTSTAAAASGGGGILSTILVFVALQKEVLSPELSPGETNPYRADIRAIERLVRELEAQLLVGGERTSGTDEEKATSNKKPNFSDDIIDEGSKKKETHYHRRRRLQQQRQLRKAEQEAFDNEMIFLGGIPASMRQLSNTLNIVMSGVRNDAKELAKVRTSGTTASRSSDAAAGDDDDDEDMLLAGGNGYMYRDVVFLFNLDPTCPLLEGVTLPTATAAVASNATDDDQHQGASEGYERDEEDKDPNSNKNNNQEEDHPPGNLKSGAAPTNDDGDVDEDGEHDDEKQQQQQPPLLEGEGSSSLFVRQQTTIAEIVGDAEADATTFTKVRRSEARAYLTTIIDRAALVASIDELQQRRTLLTHHANRRNSNLLLAAVVFFVASFAFVVVGVVASRFEALPTEQTHTLVVEHFSSPACNAYTTSSSSSNDGPMVAPAQEPFVGLASPFTIALSSVPADGQCHQVKTTAGGGGGGGGVFASPMALTTLYARVVCSGTWKGRNTADDYTFDGFVRYATGTSVRECEAAALTSTHVEQCLDAASVFSESSLMAHNVMLSCGTASDVAHAESQLHYLRTAREFFSSSSSATSAITALSTSNVAVEDTPEHLRWWSSSSDALRATTTFMHDHDGVVHSSLRPMDIAGTESFAAVASNDAARIEAQNTTTATATAAASATERVVFHGSTPSLVVAGNHSGSATTSDLAFLSTTSASGSEGGGSSSTLLSAGALKYFSAHRAVVDGAIGAEDESYTVSFWMKATTGTRGFVYAFSDDFHSSDYASIVLERLGDHIAKQTPLDPVLDTSADFGTNRRFRVFSSLYVDGASKSLRLLSYGGDSTQSIAAENQEKGYVHQGNYVFRELAWDLAHPNLKLDSVLFDGAWHLVAISFDTLYSRRRARLYVDAETDFGLSGWVQCLAMNDEIHSSSPFYPQSSTSAATAAGDAAATVTGEGDETKTVTQGPVLHIGALVSSDNGAVGGGSGVYNLQVHRGEAFGPIKVMRLGTPWMEQNATVFVPESLALGAFLVCLAVVVAGAGFVKNKSFWKHKFLHTDQKKKDVSSVSKMVSGTRAGYSAAMASSSATQQVSQNSGSFLRTAIPLFVGITQSMALYFQGWEWPEEFERITKYVVFPFSFDIPFAFPNVPPIVTPLVQLILATACVVALVWVVLYDNYKFNLCIEKARHRRADKQGGSLPNPRKCESTDVNYVVPVCDGLKLVADDSSNELLSTEFFNLDYLDATRAVDPITLRFFFEFKGRWKGAAAADVRAFVLEKLQTYQWQLDKTQTTPEGFVDWICANIGNPSNGTDNTGSSGKNESSPEEEDATIEVGSPAIAAEPSVASPVGASALEMQDSTGNGQQQEELAPASQQQHQENVLSFSAILQADFTDGRCWIANSAGDGGRLEMSVVPSLRRCPDHKTFLITAVDDIHKRVPSDNPKRLHYYHCAFDTNRAKKILFSKGKLAEVVCDQEELLVCSDDTCGYCICKKCAGAKFMGWGAAHNAASMVYTKTRSGALGVIGIIIILLIMAVYQPIVKTAIMLIYCHSTWQCEYPGCYSDPSPQFIVAVLFACFVVVFVGVGLVSLFSYILVVRKKHVLDLFHDQNEIARTAIRTRERSAAASTPSTQQNEEEGDDQDDSIDNEEIDTTPEETNAQQSQPQGDDAGADGNNHQKASAAEPDQLEEEDQAEGHEQDEDEDLLEEEKLLLRQKDVTSSSSLREIAFVGCDDERWQQFLLYDDTMLKSLYAQYEFNSMLSQPLTQILQIILVIVVVLTVPNSLLQLFLSAAVEASMMLFYAIRAPFLNEWLDFLARLGAIHQVLQLSLMAFHRVNVFNDPSNNSVSYVMLTFFFIYAVIIALVMYKLVIKPWLVGRAEAKARELEWARLENERREGEQKKRDDQAAAVIRMRKEQQKAEEEARRHIANDIASQGEFAGRGVLLDQEEEARLELLIAIRTQLPAGLAQLMPVLVFQEEDAQREWLSAQEAQQRSPLEAFTFFVASKLKEHKKKKKSNKEKDVRSVAEGGQPAAPLPVPQQQQSTAHSATATADVDADHHHLEDDDDDGPDSTPLGPRQGTAVSVLSTSTTSSSVGAGAATSSSPSFDSAAGAEASFDNTAAKDAVQPSSSSFDRQPSTTTPLVDLHSPALREEHADRQALLLRLFTQSVAHFESLQSEVFDFYVLDIEPRKRARVAAEWSEAVNIVQRKSQTKVTSMFTRERRSKKRMRTAACLVSLPGRSTVDVKIDDSQSGLELSEENYHEVAGLSPGCFFQVTSAAPPDEDLNKLMDAVGITSLVDNALRNDGLSETFVFFGRDPSKFSRMLPDAIELLAGKIGVEEELLPSFAVRCAEIDRNTVRDLLWDSPSSEPQQQQQQQHEENEETTKKQPQPAAASPANNNRGGYISLGGLISQETGMLDEKALLSKLTDKNTPDANTIYADVCNKHAQTTQASNYGYPLAHIVAWIEIVFKKAPSAEEIALANAEPDDETSGAKGAPKKKKILTKKQREKLEAEKAAAAKARMELLKPRVVRRCTFAIVHLANLSFLQELVGVEDEELAEQISLNNRAVSNVLGCVRTLTELKTIPRVGVVPASAAEQGSASSSNSMVSDPLLTIMYPMLVHTQLLWVTTLYNAVPTGYTRKQVAKHVSHSVRAMSDVNDFTNVSKRQLSMLLSGQKTAVLDRDVPLDLAIFVPNSRSRHIGQEQQSLIAQGKRRVDGDEVVVGASGEKGYWEFLPQEEMDAVIREFVKSDGAGVVEIRLDNIFRQPAAEAGPGKKLLSATDGRQDKAEENRHAVVSIDNEEQHQQPQADRDDEDDDVTAAASGDSRVFLLDLVTGFVTPKPAAVADTTAEKNTTPTTPSGDDDDNEEDLVVVTEGKPHENTSDEGGQQGQKGEAVKRADDDDDEREHEVQQEEEEEVYKYRSYTQVKLFRLRLEVDKILGQDPDAARDHLMPFVHRIDSSDTVEFYFRTLTRLFQDKRLHQPFVSRDTFLIFVEKRELVLQHRDVLAAAMSALAELLHLSSPKFVLTVSLAATTEGLKEFLEAALDSIEETGDVECAANFFRIAESASVHVSVKSRSIRTSTSSSVGKWTGWFDNSLERLITSPKIRGIVSSVENNRASPAEIGAHVRRSTEASATATTDGSSTLALPSPDGIMSRFVRLIFHLSTRDVWSRDVAPVKGEDHILVTHKPNDVISRCLVKSDLLQFLTNAGILCACLPSPLSFSEEQTKCTAPPIRFKQAAAAVVAVDKFKTNAKRSSNKVSSSATSGPRRLVYDASLLFAALTNLLLLHMIGIANASLSAAGKTLTVASNRLPKSSLAASGNGNHHQQAEQLTMYDFLMSFIDSFRSGIGLQSFFTFAYVAFGQKHIRKTMKWADYLNRADYAIRRHMPLMLAPYGASSSGASSAAAGAGGRKIVAMNMTDAEVKRISSFLSARLTLPNPGIAKKTQARADFIRTRQLPNIERSLFLQYVMHLRQVTDFSASRPFVNLDGLEDAIGMAVLGNSTDEVRRTALIDSDAGDRLVIRQQSNAFGVGFVTLNSGAYIVNGDVIFRGFSSEALMEYECRLTRTSREDQARILFYNLARGGSQQKTGVPTVSPSSPASPPSSDVSVVSPDGARPAATVVEHHREFMAQQCFYFPLIRAPLRRRLWEDVSTPALSTHMIGLWRYLVVLPKFHAEFVSRIERGYTSSEGNTNEGNLPLGPFGGFRNLIDQDDDDIFAPRKRRDYLTGREKYCFEVLLDKLLSESDASIEKKAHIAHFLELLCSTPEHCRSIVSEKSTITDSLKKGLKWWPLAERDATAPMLRFLANVAAASPKLQLELLRKITLNDAEECGGVQFELVAELKKFIRCPDEESQIAYLALLRNLMRGQTILVKKRLIELQVLPKHLFTTLGPASASCSFASLEFCLAWWACLRAFVDTDTTRASILGVPAHAETFADTQLCGMLRKTAKAILMTTSEDDEQEQVNSNEGTPPTTPPTPPAESSKQKQEKKKSPLVNSPLSDPNNHVGDGDAWSRLEDDSTKQKMVLRRREPAIELLRDVLHTLAHFRGLSFDHHDSDEVDGDNGAAAKNKAANARKDRLLQVFTANLEKSLLISLGAKKRKKKKQTAIKPQQKATDDYDRHDDHGDSSSSADDGGADSDDNREKKEEEEQELRLISSLSFGFDVLRADAESRALWLNVVKPCFVAAKTERRTRGGEPPKEKPAAAARDDEAALAQHPNVVPEDEDGKKNKKGNIFAGFERQIQKKLFGDGGGQKEKSKKKKKKKKEGKKSSEEAEGAHSDDAPSQGDPTAATSSSSSSSSDDDGDESTTNRRDDDHHPKKVDNNAGVDAEEQEARRGEVPDEEAAEDPSSPGEHPPSQEEAPAAPRPDTVSAALALVAKNNDDDDEQKQEEVASSVFPVVPQLQQGGDEVAGRSSAPAAANSSVDDEAALQPDEAEKDK